MRTVDHPNVVRYLEDGVHTHDHLIYSWLRMEFVDGEPLRGLLQRGDRPVISTSLNLIGEAIAGASAIWAAGTSHRDLSQNNLMITTDGHLVIVDLGLARQLDDESITVLPTPGTPGWMSPEQVRRPF